MGETTRERDEMKQASAGADAGRDGSASGAETDAVDRAAEADSAAPVRRRTWQREAVRDALASSSGFVSAQTLHGILSSSGRRIGLATVYRQLASLAAAEEADTLQSVDGEVVYRACDMHEHHHHLICRSCGRTVEISASPVEEWASRVAAEHGFTHDRHVIDLFGLCPDCR